MEFDWSVDCLTAPSVGNSLSLMSRKRGEDDLIEPKDPESESFIRALVARGQAARPNQDGSLPPGVTHEIVGETEQGIPILRRRRFA